MCNNRTLTHEPHKRISFFFIFHFSASAWCATRNVSPDRESNLNAKMQLKILIIIIAHTGGGGGGGGGDVCAVRILNCNFCIFRSFCFGYLAHSVSDNVNKC